jgi:hypothetical protein
MNTNHKNNKGISGNIKMLPKPNIGVSENNKVAVLAACGPNHFVTQAKHQVGASNGTQNGRQSYGKNTLTKQRL